MNFIFLGPPGAGKGSLAVKVASEYDIPHISTGDIFRAAIKNQTPLGKKVKSIIDSGALVSDEITCALVEERLKEDDTKAGYILDGFPRTIAQAEMFQKIAHDAVAVNFVISTDEVVKRLSTRRVCKACGANYNIVSVPPKVAGVCDICGGELYQRDDDKEESIAKRMAVYKTQTEPLIDFYRKKNALVDFDSTVPTAKLLEAFKKKFPKNNCN